MRRVIQFITGGYYHVFNKSIADFTIFNNETDFQRILQSVRYYQYDGISMPFSKFREMEKVKKKGVEQSLADLTREKEKKVLILAFCFMPTHVHFLVKQLGDNGISHFMRNILNSYACYFNKKHRRSGPLWTGRFKGVLAENDEQLLHFTRYVHLNPTTAFLVNKPEDWRYSSYKEYIDPPSATPGVAEGVFGMTPSAYQKFVEDRIAYQRDLGLIKRMLLE